MEQELKHQVNFIIDDIIFKTFTQSERIWLLLYNINYQLAQKIANQSNNGNNLFTKAYHFFQFDEKFLHKGDFLPTILSTKAFKIGFWDKRELNRCYKKAIADHQGEINKMSNTTIHWIEAKTKNYITMFYDMHHYLTQANNGNK